MYLGGIIDDATLGLGDFLLFVSGVENELAKVVGESGFVGIKSLLTSVLTSVINIDSD